jgi:hypothetical protein
VCRYFPSDPHFLFDTNIVPFEERDSTALAASVIGHCSEGNRALQFDPGQQLAEYVITGGRMAGKYGYPAGLLGGRHARTWILAKLSNLISVHNYGICLHNKNMEDGKVSKWSSEGPRSKRALLRRYKFCIAFEVSLWWRGGMTSVCVRLTSRFLVPFTGGSLYLLIPDILSLFTLTPALSRFLFYLYPHYLDLFHKNAAEPGYATEKLADCLAVGSIPIYWGVGGFGANSSILPDDNLTSTDFGDLADMWPLAAESVIQVRRTVRRM